MFGSFFFLAFFHRDSENTSEMKSKTNIRKQLKKKQKTTTTNWPKLWCVLKKRTRQDETADVKPSHSNGASSCDRDL